MSASVAVAQSSKNKTEAPLKKRKTSNVESDGHKTPTKRKRSLSGTSGDTSTPSGKVTQIKVEKSPTNGEKLSKEEKKARKAEKKLAKKHRKEGKSPKKEKKKEKA